MKKTININFQGQLITIEETAYNILNEYIQSLKAYFKDEVEGNEIVNDIESRIAELFGNRLKHGIPCITDEDVRSVINTIGKPEEFDMEFGDVDEAESMPPPLNSSNTEDSEMPPPVTDNTTKSLYRKSNDRILGGVCSGLAHYLKIDPVFVRLGFVFISSIFFWIYIIMWIVLPQRALPNNLSKRLYRNPNDRFIAGVCGGIAAYFKIDTWIPRLIFLLPLILNLLGLIRIPLNIFNHFLWNSTFDLNFGSGINLTVGVVYIIFWIIMPKAITVKQKLEMMGEEQYLQSIRASVNSNVAHARSGRTDAGNNNSANNVNVKDNDAVENHYSAKDDYSEKNSGRTPPPPPRTTYITPQSERSGCLNLFTGFLKVLFFAFVGIVAAGLMISIFSLLFTGAQFAPLQSLFVNSGFEHVLLWLTIILTLIIPVIAVITWIVRRIMKARSLPIIGYTVAGLWFVGIVAGLTLGFKITRKFSTESLEETNITLTPPSSNKLYVEMERYSLDYFSVKPSAGKFTLGVRGNNIFSSEKLPFFNIEEDSLLFNTIQLKMKTSKDSLFHVKTIFISSDKNYKAAKANLKKFDFRIAQDDSVLLVPQFLKIPKEQGYRNQLVIVEIFVPSGSKLEVSEELADYQRSLSSQAMRRRYGDDYGYRNSFEWNSEEEYVMENEEITETQLLKDSI